MVSYISAIVNALILNKRYTLRLMIGKQVIQVGLYHLRAGGEYGYFEWRNGGIKWRGISEAIKYSQKTYMLADYIYSSISSSYIYMITISCVKILSKLMNFLFFKMGIYLVMEL